MLGRIPKNGCLTREFAKRKSQARRYAFIIEKHLLKLILFTTQSNNYFLQRIFAIIFLECFGQTPKPFEFQIDTWLLNKQKKSRCVPSVKNYRISLEGFLDSDFRFQF